MAGRNGQVHVLECLLDNGFTISNDALIVAAMGDHFRDLWPAGMGKYMYWSVCLTMDSQSVMMRSLLPQWVTTFVICGRQEWASTSGVSA